MQEKQQCCVKNSARNLEVISLHMHYSFTSLHVNSALTCPRLLPYLCLCACSVFLFRPLSLHQLHGAPTNAACWQSLAQPQSRLPLPRLSSSPPAQYVFLSHCIHCYFLQVQFWVWRDGWQNERHTQWCQWPRRDFNPLPFVHAAK